jgi:pyrroloquinoline quinone biosynthesis protein E
MNPPFPIFLQYELTYKCQSRCIFCYNSKIGRNLNPPVSITWKIVKKLGELNIPHIQLTGGEVALISFLPKIVKYLNNKTTLSLVTNGIKKIEVPASDLVCIYISLHGSRAEIHERLTRMPGTYDKICKNIMKYKKEGFSVSLDVLLSSYNYFDMYNIVKKGYELGVDRIYINRHELGGEGYYSSFLVPNISQFRQAVDELIAAKRDFKIDIMFGTAIPFCVYEKMINEFPLPDCGAGFWHATIDPFGNVKICNQAPYNIGNILTDSLEKIWSNKNKIIKEYRSLKWLFPPCDKCLLRKFCMGGCRVDATCSIKRIATLDVYLRNGLIRAPSRNTQKRLLRTIIRKIREDTNKYLKEVLKEKGKLRFFKSGHKLYIISPSGIIGVPKRYEKYFARAYQQINTP